MTINRLFAFLLIAETCMMIASLLWWLAFDSEKSWKTSIATMIAMFVTMFLFAATLQEPIKSIVLFTI